MLKQLELLTHAITAVKKGIGIVDEDGKFVWANDYLGKVHGCSPKELIGQYYTTDFLKKTPLVFGNVIMICFLVSC